MTDPWTDVREKARRNWQDAPYPLAQARTDFDKLQRDADALLAVKRAYKELNEHTDHELPPPFQKSCAQCDYKEADGHWKECPWAEIEEALAALPERLR